VSAALRVELETAPIARAAADVACVGLFEDERPPRGDAGRADWRLCGLLSELMVAGLTHGAVGEAVLLPSAGRLAAPRVLVQGLGRKEEFDGARARELLRDALERALDLSARHVLVCPPHQTPSAAWLAALLEAAAAAARERGALRLAVRVDPESRMSTARALHAAASAPALRGASVELPPLVEPATHVPSPRAPSSPTPPGAGPSAPGVPRG
jgi:hypothetical protein